MRWAWVVVMRWLSIDPATKTGIARWEGAKLVSVATLRPPLAAEQRRHPEAALVLVTGTTVTPFATPLTAWGTLLVGAQMVVVEEGVDSAALVAGLKRRGHRAAAEVAGAEDLAQVIAADVRADDMIVCLGAGDITKWAAGLAAAVSAELETQAA